MFRTASLIFLTLIACAALLSTPAAAARQFPETGYSITNDKFLDYFDHRGGARTLGYPVSREFDFLGTRVQFFQRAVLQLQRDGGVGLLNVLDSGLLPYTRINGSTFPAVNDALVQAAPSPADPDYATKAVDFVRAFAPESYEGLPTRFFSTFMNTVSFQEAFPSGRGEPGLLPLIALEIWGLPTSKPTYDANNGSFVYLRFQRGIMHFDKTTGATQGILIGDHLKSLITGQNLPPDLEQEARGGKLVRQYNNSVGGTARPADLPGTNLFAAFEKDGVVVPTAQPTAIPVPATATPVPPAATPAPVATPTAIAVAGSTSWFVEQTNGALNLLATKTPGWYSVVRQNVYRIEQTNGSSSWDAASRTLFVNESVAFTSDFRFSTANQMEWYAGLIVHHATHIEQAVNGRRTTGYDAEREARTRQKDVLGAIETTCPGGQFVNLINDLLAGREASWGEWDAPKSPLAQCTPTPTP